MSEKRNVFGFMKLFFIVGFLLTIFVGLTAYSFSKLFSEDLSIEDTQIKGDSKSPIAVVEVEGVIMDSTSTLEKLFIAEKDKNIKAIILRVNSPGGAVGPTQEIYDEIIRINSIKPVYASLATVAASGGYYIAAATRKIYANPGVLTGSIGVIMNFMDLSSLYEWAKVNPETIKAGKFKDIGSPSRKMKDEERALLNTMTEEVHKQFIEAIFAVRSDRIKNGLEGLKEYAQGQIFSGEGAKEIGLVDELGGMWKLARDIHKELGLKGEFSPNQVKTIKRSRAFDIKDFLGGLEETVKDFSFKVKTKSMPMFEYNP